MVDSGDLIISCVERTAEDDAICSDVIGDSVVPGDVPCDDVTTESRVNCSVVVTPDVASVVVVSDVVVDVVISVVVATDELDISVVCSEVIT